MIWSSGARKRVQAALSLLLIGFSPIALAQLSPAELFKQVAPSVVVDAAVAAAADSVMAADEESRRRDRWWTFYEGDDYALAFDIWTVQKDNNKVVAWGRIRLAKSRTTSSGDRFDEAVTRYTFYCGNRRMSYDQFTRRDAVGNVVTSRDLKSYEIEITGVIPETIGEAQYDAACSL